jgi:ubiquinone/menaquinone biosynthesis C-methylase UbiE
VADERISAIDHSTLTAYFGRLAKSYGEGEYFRRRRAAALGAIAPEVASARAVLDLGCGPGALLRDLAASAPETRLVGADLSPEMLAQARSRLGARASFVRADANALPFKPASWDLVLCSHVLQFVGDLPQCVTGIARCLRAGGVLVTTVEDSSMRETLGAIMPAREWEEFRQAVFVARRADRAARRPRGDIYRQAFESAGLETELRSAPFTVTWPDIEEWVRVRWIPATSEANRAQIEEIMARVRSDDKVAAATLHSAEKLLLGRKPAR